MQTSELKAHEEVQATETAAISAPKRRRLYLGDSVEDASSATTTRRGENMQIDGDA